MTAVSKPAPRAPGSSPKAGAEDCRAVGGPQPLLRSADLFSNSREILIEHAGVYYRLRLTQSNKLILTK